ncbi:CobW family GTP-binding protein [Cohnella algarum]|uniref:CobW family GTP-binding protein n=1 Tax=Cohnella algarum TaxID=2044859 RepID=UPI001967BB6B|nr:GTP-binding protein [Cohnella algarum]MBN2984562.1 GTP-binding protein [Cohnella algarum]
MATYAIILSGFLGSGKTTLLVRLLREAKARGLKPGILINELGKNDVDGLAAGDHTDGTIEKLLDGCVCCDKKSELEGALLTLLAARPDVLFIELSGVADPQEIADALASPRLRERVAIRRTVTMLDAEHTLDYNNLFLSDRRLVRTLRRQIEGADLLVVNKTDLASPRKLEKFEPFVRRLNGKAELVHAVRGEIALAPLLDGIAPTGEANRPRSLPVLSGYPERQPARAHDHRPEHSGSYGRLRASTLTITGERLFDRERVESFLRRWEDRLVRAKGYIPAADDGSMQFLQYAGKRFEWERSSYPGTPYLVVIGVDMDEKRLAAEWNELGAAAT